MNYLNRARDDPHHLNHREHSFGSQSISTFSMLL